MGHQRLKSDIGYSSLALGGGAQTGHLNIIERSLRSVSSHCVYSDNV